jgi:hypothetical protein
VVILALMKQHFLLHNALVILLTKILVITKRNIWLITNHSSHHWIFSLTRSMMTFLVYIENQNFTRIHIWGKKWDAIVPTLRFEIWKPTSFLVCIDNIYGLHLKGQTQILSQNWNWFKIYSHGFIPKWIMARQWL